MKSLPLLGVIACLSLAGVASCSDQFPSSTLTAAQIENSSLDCPFAQAIPVDVDVADIKDGVAIKFSGPMPAVDLIRANVHTMKYVNGSQGNPFAVCPCLNDALDSGPAAPWYDRIGDTPHIRDSDARGASFEGLGSTQQRSPVPADASMDETPLGALLVLRPKDPTLLQSLRDEVRANVGAMRTACIGPY